VLAILGVRSYLWLLSLTSSTKYTLDSLIGYAIILCNHADGFPLVNPTWYCSSLSWRDLPLWVLWS